MIQGFVERSKTKALWQLLRPYIVAQRALFPSNVLAAAAGRAEGVLYCAYVRRLDLWLRMGDERCAAVYPIPEAFDELLEELLEEIGELRRWILPGFDRGESLKPKKAQQAEMLVQAGFSYALAHEWAYAPGRIGPRPDAELSLEAYKLKNKGLSPQEINERLCPCKKHDDSCREAMRQRIHKVEALLEKYQDSGLPPYVIQLKPRI
jgi:hypothetical protein